MVRAWLTVVVSALLVLSAAAQNVPENKRILKDLYRDIDDEGRFQWTKSYSAVKNDCTWGDCSEAYADEGQVMKAGVVLTGVTKDGFYALTSAVGVEKKELAEFTCHYCPVGWAPLCTNQTSQDGRWQLLAPWSCMRAHLVRFPSHCTS